ncbi:uncharacterized protein LOC122500088, partial [Leptopilina heterotoma]|uniref:uncharacterized protein LOC122500088 n=1 Tax=Leptopilina heterotoma TaxID=63436 RepID=UPI001CAA3C05
IALYLTLTTVTFGIFDKVNHSLCLENQKWLTEITYQTSNRTNQCNPNHPSTGPGHQAGYHGAGTKADLDNRGRQMNPQDSKYTQRK